MCLTTKTENLYFLYIFLFSSMRRFFWYAFRVDLMNISKIILNPRSDIRPKSTKIDKNTISQEVLDDQNRKFILSIHIFIQLVEAILLVRFSSRSDEQFKNYSKPQVRYSTKIHQKSTKTPYLKGCLTTKTENLYFLYIFMFSSMRRFFWYAFRVDLMNSSKVILN